MSTTVTDEPLHEIVLKILFFEDTEKAAKMTAENVLWKIDNPEISERQVREVLDWLVRQKRVELYLGKYSLDRIEFLEQKEIFENQKVDEKKINLKPKPKTPNKVPKPTFYLKPAQKDNSKLLLYLFLAVLAFSLYTTFSFLKINNSYDYINEKTEKKPLSGTVSEQPKLYVSTKENYEKSIKSVSYSFAQQNKINAVTLKEINNLHTNLDSINKIYQKEIIEVKTELKCINENANNLMAKIIIGNLILVILIIVTYLKKT